MSYLTLNNLFNSYVVKLSVDQPSEQLEKLSKTYLK